MGYVRIRTENDADNVHGGDHGHPTDSRRIRPALELLLGGERRAYPTHVGLVAASGTADHLPYAAGPSTGPTSTPEGRLQSNAQDRCLPAGRH